MNALIKIVIPLIVFQACNNKPTGIHQATNLDKRSNDITVNSNGKGELQKVNIANDTLPQPPPKKESLVPLKNHATGKIIGGYVPEMGDLWGSAYFQFINSKEKIWLSYFGQYIGSGKIDACICCNGSRYKNEIVEIEFTRKYEWVPISIVSINDVFDTVGKVNVGFNKRDGVRTFTGILRSAENGDYATYITVEKDDGSIFESSYGYVDVSDSLIDQRVKLVVAREWINYFKKCKLVK